MELMEKVKAECEKHKNCSECPFADSYEICNLTMYPEHWDIEAIRKALGETSDKASDKEEIVVPKKITTGYATKANPDVNARTINEIIECLEKIKERME